jgi:Trk K+ transport system NAD-binding subunit
LESPEELKIDALVSHPDLHSECQYGNAEVEMVEVALPAGLIGKSVSEITVPGEVSVSAIVRAGQAVLPTEDWSFEKDDVLFVNVLRESAEKLERLLGLKE